MWAVLYFVAGDSEVFYFGLQLIEALGVSLSECVGRSN